MNRNRSTPIRRRTERRGYIAPIIALLLCVVLGALALVADQLWLDMASNEAQTVAEVTALAAAQELAADDLLRKDQPVTERIKAARHAAWRVAQSNLIAGQPQPLNVQTELVFGSRVQVEDTGEIKFIQTEEAPLAVQALASRTHQGGNPVARFLVGLTGQRAADVRAAAEAEINPHVVGVKVISGSPVPILPLAILLPGDGTQTQCWSQQIEQRKGTDQFGIDPETGKVVANADGIPEITLRTCDYEQVVNSSQPATSNAAWVHVAKTANDFPLDEQIARGWDASDLADLDGRFVLSGGPVLMPAKTLIGNSTHSALAEIVGQNRIVLLYESFQAEGHSGWGRAQVVGLAAGRIMSIRIADGAAREIVFQPGVLATRQAVLADEVSSEPLQVAPNPYLYKLHLTQ